MNKQQFLVKHESLAEFGTGGGCTAIGGDLSVLQNEILITDGEATAPDDNASYFQISISNGEGEHVCFFETTNWEHLSELVDACFVLWGN